MGIPHVAIFAGQSNITAAEGTTLETGTTPGTSVSRGQEIPRTYIFRTFAGGFEPLVVGVNTVMLPQNTPGSINNFGPETGSALKFRISNPDDDFLILKHALGDTSILVASEWDPRSPNANLWSNLKNDLRTVLHIAGRAAVVDGFNLALGEQDRTSTGQLPAIMNNRRLMIADVNQIVGRPVRFNDMLLTQRGDGASAAATTSFRQAQIDLADDPKMNMRLVNCDNLGKVGAVHFNPPGVIAFGERFHDATFGA